MSWQDKFFGGLGCVTSNGLLNFKFWSWCGYRRFSTEFLRLQSEAVLQILPITR